MDATIKVLCYRNINYAKNEAYCIFIDFDFLNSIF